MLDAITTTSVRPSVCRDGGNRPATKTTSSQPGWQSLKPGPQTRSVSVYPALSKNS